MLPRSLSPIHFNKEEGEYFMAGVEGLLDSPVRSLLYGQQPASSFDPEKNVHISPEKRAPRSGSPSVIFLQNTVLHGNTLNMSPGSAVGSAALASVEAASGRPAPIDTGLVTGLAARARRAGAGNRMGQALGSLNAESPDTAELEGHGPWGAHGAAGSVPAVPPVQSALEPAEVQVQATKAKWTLERHVAILNMMMQVDAVSGKKFTHDEIYKRFGGGLHTIKRHVGKMLLACADIHQNRAANEHALNLPTATEQYVSLEAMMNAVVLKDQEFAQRPENLRRWDFSDAVAKHAGYNSFVELLRQHGAHLAANKSEPSRVRGAASCGVAHTAGLFPGASAAGVDPSAKHLAKMAAEEAKKKRTADKQAVAVTDMKKGDSAVKQQMMLSGASGDGNPYSARAEVHALQHSAAASTPRHAPDADPSVIFDHVSYCVVDVTTPVSGAGGSAPRQPPPPSQPDKRHKSVALLSQEPFGSVAGNTSRRLDLGNVNLADIDGALAHADALKRVYEAESAKQASELTSIKEQLARQQEAMAQQLARQQEAMEKQSAMMANLLAMMGSGSSAGR